VNTNKRENCLVKLKCFIKALCFVNTKKKFAKDVIMGQNMLRKEKKKEGVVMLFVGNLATSCSNEKKI
jgi:hypothetical protein